LTRLCRFFICNLIIIIIIIIIITTTTTTTIIIIIIIIIVIVIIIIIIIIIVINYPLEHAVHTEQSKHTRLLSLLKTKRRRPAW